MNRAASKRNVGDVRLPVGEPLVLCAFDSLYGAVGVVEAEADAAIVAEVVFSQVAVQMLLRAVLIDAAHTALEDVEDALDSVGMDVVADIFASRVLYRHVLREVGLHLAIEAAFVGMDLRFARDILARRREALDLERERRGLRCRGGGGGGFGGNS